MDYNRDPVACVDDPPPPPGLREENEEEPRSLVGELWHAHRKKLVGPFLFVLLVYGVLETINQVRIQRASGRLRDGEYSKALETLKGPRLGILRGGLARRIRDEASYHLAIANLTKAIESLNWYLADQSLATAVRSGVGLDEYSGEVAAAIRSWHAGLLRTLEEGDLARCRAALDMLTSIEYTEADHRAAVDDVSRDVSARLLRGFTEHEAWTEALREARRIAERQRGAQEQTADPLAFVRTRMTAALDEATAKGQFSRAEAIIRLLESHFSGDERGRKLLADLQFARILAKGEQLERDRRFDRALEEYEKALRLRPGDAAAFGKIRSLRQALTAYTKASGEWEERPGPAAGTGESELARAAEICGRSGRSRRLVRTKYTGGKRTEVPLRRLGEARLWSKGRLQGSWTAALERSDTGRQIWVVRGEVENERTTYRKRAYSDLAVGAVIRDRDSTPLAGAVLDIPILLPGESRQFELRLPRQEGEYELTVGLKP